MNASPQPPDRGADARHAARSGALQLLSVLGQGLMPVTHILVARLFGLATFGAYQANVAIVEVLSRAGLVGAVGSQHRFIAAHRVAGEEDLAQRALGTGLRLAGGMSGVLAIGLGLLAPLLARAWNEPSLAIALPIMAPAVLLSALTSVAVGATMGAKVARMSLYVRGIAEPMLAMAGAIVAWRAGASLRGLSAAYVVASALVATLAVIACARVFGAPYLGRALRAPRHPTLLQFALPMGASEVLGALLQRADTFIIATFAGLDAFAVYAAAEYVTRLIANPRYVFDHVVAPVIAEALHLGDRARVRYNLALVTRWVTTASAPIAVTMIVLRAEILRLYGPAFVTGASVLVLLAFSHLLTACLGLTPYVVAMGGRSRLLLVNNLGAAIVNVTLGVLLVPRMGIVGAPIAVLVSIAAFYGALTIEAWFLERVHPFTTALLKPVIAAVGAFAAEIAVHGRVERAGARVVLVIAVGLAVYLAALLALGLGPEERALVSKVTSKLTRRFRRRRPSPP